MHHHVPSLFVAPLALLFLFLLTSPAPAFQAKVVGITDGDSIKVLRNDQQVKIRLYGIDCPEKGQPFGKAAKKFTSSLAAGKTIKVDPVTKDRYGRTVAMVYVNDQSLNESIIRAGYAWVYKQYCREPFCYDWFRHEATARERKKGLWREPGAIPPWEWRRKK